MLSLFKIAAEFTPLSEPMAMLLDADHIMNWNWNTEIISGN